MIRPVSRPASEFQLTRSPTFRFFPMTALVGARRSPTHSRKFASQSEVPVSICRGERRDARPSRTSCGNLAPHREPTRKQMLKFYYSGAPNPMKVALFLEEAELPYEAIPIDTRKGDQHKAAYVAINPNAKVPAIVDGDAVVFDSNAI